MLGKRNQNTGDKKAHLDPADLNLRSCAVALNLFFELSCSLPIPLAGGRCQKWALLEGTQRAAGTPREDWLAGELALIN